MLLLSHPSASDARYPRSGAADLALIHATTTADTRETRRAAFVRLNTGFRTIKLHLTPTCNLRCQGCYDGPRCPSPLTLTELYRVLEMLRGHPCRLDLMGGEPTLHPDLVALVRYATHDCGVGDICLYTNGTRISASFANQLRDAVDSHDL